MISNSHSSDVRPILAALDAGGTTFKCALIREGEGVITSVRVPTATPSETLAACSRFFQEQAAKGLMASAMGIASLSGSSSGGLALERPEQSRRME